MTINMLEYKLNENECTLKFLKEELDTRDRSNKELR